MSKYLLVAGLLAILGFGACKKDEVDPNVPSHFKDKGHLKFQNNSADLYDIYLDDARYGNLYGGDTTVYKNIPIGVHRVKAIQIEQVSGSPILRQQNITIYKDSTVTFAFP